MNNQLEADGIGIYVVHGITGYERRERRLEELLKTQHELQYKLVTESSDPQKNSNWISQYFTEGINLRMGKNALFCTLVHILCYEAFLTSDDKYAVIFENDICLFRSFKDKLKKIFKEADNLPEGFIISIENSTLRFPSFWKTEKDKFLYPASSGRCAGAYIVDKAAVRNILEDLKVNPCNEVIDFWHNDLISRNIVRMYWAHPPITEQGSSNGKFDSSSSFNKGGMVRYMKWTVQKFYKMYILRPFV